jgi:hypothetical protein
MKEWEELVIGAVVLLVVLQVLKGGGSVSTTQAAQIQAGQNTAFAGDVTSIINNAINQFS